MQIYEQNFGALVLAAGKGTRMGSGRPKVLRELLGEPMLGYVLAALRPIFCNAIWVVAGHEPEKLEAAFPESQFVLQVPQLGTGHAVAMSLDNAALAEKEYLLIINGDAPLITTDIIKRFLLEAAGHDLAFAVITPPDPGPYGRVLRKDGKPVAIIEARDFNPDIHQGFEGEVNAGMYFARAAALGDLLRLVGNDNKSGEYYLTDIVGLAIEAGLSVGAVNCGDDPCLMGVNTPGELASAEEILAGRRSRELLASGVILHMPSLVRCGPAVEIEAGAEISGPCEIYGKTSIAANAVVDSNCVIINSHIQAGSHIFSFCHIVDATVGPDCLVGPYARLRPQARLERRSHVGNFVELKKATLGEGAKANHLSYLGDAEIGPGANIGAGTITCNYDGREKHITSIGKNAFIGSNSALVAPVAIGDDSLVGAGSVITKDVPADSLAIARARQQNLKRKK